MFFKTGRVWCVCDRPQFLMLMQLWVNVKCEGLLTRHSRKNRVGKLKRISLSLSPCLYIYTYNYIIIYIQYIFVYTYIYNNIYTIMYIHMITHVKFARALLSASFGIVMFLDYFQSPWIHLSSAPLASLILFTCRDCIGDCRIATWTLAKDHLLDITGLRFMLLVGALISGLSLGSATFSRAQANPKLNEFEVCKSSSIW